MKKELITLQTDTKLTISKTKSLLALKNKLIPKRKNKLIDDSWIERLWAWADENDISDLEWVGDDENGYWRGIPRDKEKLLNLVNFPIHNDKSKQIVSNKKKKTSENQIIKKIELNFGKKYKK